MLREKVAQAYDFSLDKMGLDIASFPLWNEYIKFLKGVEAVGNYAESQKITAIRKIYQKGIVNPMINIEQLWYVTIRVTVTLVGLSIMVHSFINSNTIMKWQSSEKVYWRRSFLMYWRACF